MNLYRNIIRILGGLCASILLATTTGPAYAFTDYGSGQGADWTTSAHLVSSPDIIRTVKSRDGIFMFGDSITVGTARDLAVRLRSANGTLLAVDAWGARPTAPAVDALANWKDRYGLPHRILMATGSNDIFNPTVMAAQIERVMALAGPAVQVYWVDIQIARIRQPALVQLADQRNSGWINGTLFDAAGRHPNLHIISWSRFLDVKPTRLTAYLRDGVHTTDAGTAARNALIVKYVT